MYKSCASRRPRIGTLGMGGLSFGTILTMVVVPVLYATLYQVPAES